MQEFLSPRQLQFCLEANRKWNLAHGSVRSGKTIGTLFAFLKDCYQWPDSNIFMFGHTSKTIWRNVIRLIFDSPQMSVFKPFATWNNGTLLFRDKVITILGAEDEGAIGKIQGLSISLCYCDEMTLYPDSVIQMIDTRLSFPHSKGYASMNPSYPDHKLKQWIDKADEGDKNYYSLHWTLDDNPYLDDDYKSRIKNSLSGLFFKRNYLGLWVLADGAIFDFFDTDVHVLKRPPCAANYWIAGIDVGTNNPFACVLIGVSTGKTTQTGRKLWVEKEYFWDQSKMGRQKTYAELARDVKNFFGAYDVRHTYIDPSAAAFKADLRKIGIHPIDADNDVLNGIGHTVSEMKDGNLFILEECKNTIREIQSYVWDSKAARKGYDEPIKKDDHTVDALRYAIHTHKVNSFDPDDYYRKQEREMRNRTFR